MSQITGPLSINNGAATPVAKSFAPQQVSPALSIFTERTAVQSMGYLKLAIVYNAASSKRPTHRIDVNFDYPVIENVDNIPTVTKKALFKGYFVIPDNMTTDERSNVIAFVANTLDNAQIRAVVRDLDPLY